MEKIHIVVSWEANFRAFIKYKEDECRLHILSCYVLYIYYSISSGFM